MRRRLTVMALFMATLSTSAVVFGKRNVNDKRTPDKHIRVAAARAQDSNLPATRPAPIPEHLTYGFFFNQIIALQQRATGRPDASVIGQVIRTSIEREANLNGAQILALNNIAFACVQQLRQQDARAGQIIAAFRARYPQRIIPPGESPPPPPAELRVLQEERNAIILRARDRLRQVLGEQAFNRLDEILKRSTSSNVRALSPGASQSGLHPRQQR